VRRRYEQELADTGATDHDGTILEATAAARRRPDLLPWRHVIVDEYQDVNPAQAAFVHALTTPKRPGPGGEGATLIGVGDDWQAIFGFQGGDPSLIRTTADPAGVVRTLCEPITLVNGYRFGQALADASRAVVTMDPKARDRPLRGLGPDPVGGVPPVSVTGARPTPALAAELGPTATPTTAAVLAAFAYWIPEHEAETEEEATEPVTVLVMGRRNIDVLDPPRDARGGAGLDRRCLNAAARQYGLEVEYRTIHAAKGGEADYAVLIDSGPPKSATAPARLALDRAIAAETGGGRHDEHQLWYVALTRARYAALIVVSDPESGASPVTRAVVESADPRLTVASHRLEAWLEPVRKAVPCPSCSPGGAGTGRLRGMSGRTGHFAVCTNWNGGDGCEYTQPSCGACGTGMLVEVPGGLFECSDSSCRSKQPGCRCRPPRPMVVRRSEAHAEAFLGLLAVRRGRRVGRTRPSTEPRPAGRRRPSRRRCAAASSRPGISSDVRGCVATAQTHWRRHADRPVTASGRAPRVLWHVCDTLLALLANGRQANEDCDNAYMRPSPNRALQSWHCHCRRRPPPNQPEPSTVRSSTRTATRCPASW
jgi:DNA helicase-4